MRGLYAIVDLASLRARQIDPVAFSEAVLTARPAALQLRAKGASPRDTMALLRTLAPMCHRVSVPLVANDRPDWALFTGCDMVHVGQSDMPIDRVRRLAPGMGVGVSTHTTAELQAAIEGHASYVAFGPVFETMTKENPDPIVGIAGLYGARRVAAVACVPLVAIGGITRERASSLVGAADAIAVIGALLPPATVGGERRAMSDVLSEVAGRARELSGLFTLEPALVGAGDEAPR
jgi:thiamine-phosphate pyrophosphorylase